MLQVVPQQTPSAQLVFRHWLLPEQASPTPPFAVQIPVAVTQYVPLAQFVSDVHFGVHVVPEQT
jgi:hypothetical protein